MYKALFLFVWLMGMSGGMLYGQERSEHIDSILDSLEREDYPVSTFGVEVHDNDQGFIQIVAEGLSFEFGFDFLHDAPRDLRNNWWPSGGYQFNVQYAGRLRDSKFYLSYGAFIGAHRFELRDRFILEKGSERTEVVDIEEANLISGDIDDVESNRFAFTYIGVPLEFCYYRSARRKKGLMLRFGGYIGVVTNARVIIDYEQNGQDKRLKSKGNKDFQFFRYGLQGSLGFSGIALFYRYHLSPIFKDGKGPVGSDDTRYSMLGFRFGL